MKGKKVMVVGKLVNGGESEMATVVKSFEGSVCVVAIQKSSLDSAHHEYKGPEKRLA